MKVVDLVGPHCLTMDDGEIVYRLLDAALASGDALELDFDGVAMVASPFFNAAVGQLLAKLSEGDLRARLRIEGLSDAGAHVLERVITNSGEYYSNPDMQKSIDRILEGADDQSC